MRSNVIFVGSIFHVDEDNDHVFVIPISFLCFTFVSIPTLSPDSITVCSHPYSLLRSRFRFVSANGDSRLPLVSSLINSATGRLPCFGRVGIKFRILLPLGLLCAARELRVLSRSGRQSAQERTYV